MHVGEPPDERRAAPRADTGIELVVESSVERAAGGSVVLEAVFRREYPRLVALARLLVDHQVEAEEIVQEAFVRALAGWSRIENRDDPLPYVRRTVVNLSRDGLRRRRTARGAPAPVAAAAAPADVGVVLDEDQRELAAALRSLPQRQRECVVLRYLLDLSTADTAATLGVTTGSVKTHLSRGLSALEEALEGTR
jgi:RNA polymerase sigma-70 factor (sigma-E family)